MSTKIEIIINDQSFAGELNDSPGAQTITDSLPLTVQMSRWGDEYYGECGLNLAEDSSAREIMEIGEIAFWPAGRALCIFFGPTPVSTDSRPRAASPVIPVGMVVGDVEKLKNLGARITAEFRK